MSSANEIFGNSTGIIMVERNLSDNDSVEKVNALCCLLGEAHIGSVLDPDDDHSYQAAFGSAIFMFVTSFLTALANSFLLLALYIDPLKIFRNPTTYFLIGLAIVDLVTALVQEPIYAPCFVFQYLQNPLTEKCMSILDAVYYFSAFTMTASFLIVFALTVTQFIVVSWPLKYGRFVTKKKVLVTVVVIYLYSAAFWCLPLMGMSSNVQHVVELFVHEYFMLLITIVFYILLHRAMKKKMAAGISLQNESRSHDIEGKRKQVQRNFVRVNFTLLTVLTVCFLPSIIMWTIRQFTEDVQSPSAKILIGHLMVDNLLYLKFLLDPFVYAWRMPKYRESLSKIVCHKNICREWNRNGNEGKLAVGEVRDDGLSFVELNRSVMTLLRFKNITEAPVTVE